VSATRSSSQTAASPYKNVIRAAEGEPHRTQLRTMTGTVEVAPPPFKDSTPPGLGRGGPDTRANRLLG
jgi:hypothetical protein